MADLALRAELANCNCIRMPGITLANPDQPEEFEAEMNLPCPAHGVRRLGRIMRLVFVKSSNAGRAEMSSPRLDELITTYEGRFVQADREDVL